MTHFSIEIVKNPETLKKKLIVLQDQVELKNIQVIKLKFEKTNSSDYLVPGNTHKTRVKILPLGELSEDELGITTIQTKTIVFTTSQTRILDLDLSAVGIGLRVVQNKVESGSRLPLKIKLTICNYSPEPFVDIKTLDSSLRGD